MYYILFFLIISFLIIFLYYFFRPTRFFSLNELNSVTPLNSIFAIDLHGVVLHIKIRSVLCYMWNEFKKTDFLLLILNPIFWPFLFYICRIKFHTEETFTYFIKKIPFFGQFKDVYIHILSLQNINIPIVQLLLTLKKNGYHLYALSNIWPSALHKLRLEHPILDDIFIDYFIPNNLERSSKPEKKFFEDFKRYILTKEGNKKIIFVDDRLSNVNASRCFSMYGFPVYMIDQLVNYSLSFKSKI